MSSSITRRNLLAASAALPAATTLLSSAARSAEKTPEQPQMRYGLVTYMWGASWDLPTLIANCEKARCFGVELRSTHAHKVEPSIDAAARKNVRQRFADTPVELVGLGSNERFDNPDPAVVKQAIEASKAFLQLSHDVGSSGVKVKPDRFYPDVPQEKTIEQIGTSLNELGKTAADLNQEVRLEVHGQCRELPTIAKILEVADHPAVKICWNSNEADLEGQGLEYNYNLVKDRWGATAHVRELDDPSYPYDELLSLLVADNWTGWLMTEASSKPEDTVAALARQSKLFDTMLAAAKSKRG